MEEVRQLKLVIKKNKFIYTQLLRNEKFAIYGQYDPSVDKVIGYEVFRILTIKRKQVNLPEKNFFLEAGTYEKHPSDSDFGKTAWACSNFDNAMQRFDEMTLTSKKRENSKH
jgi:hypothetical protein